MDGLKVKAQPEDALSEAPCPLCRRYRTADGFDPCLGKLPGVKHACCGHGVEEGYVHFTTGHTLRGTFDHVKMMLATDAKRQEMVGCP